MLTSAVPTNPFNESEGWDSTALISFNFNEAEIGAILITRYFLFNENQDWIVATGL